MIGICVNMNYITSFSDFSTNVAMATDFMAKFWYMFLFGRVAFEDGLQ